LHGVEAVMPEHIFNITAKLSDLFPPDDPDSTWLLRLALLRDDLEYEIVPKGARHDDPSGVWSNVYGLRKLAITVGEVKNIFSHDVAPYLLTMDWPSDVVKAMQAAVAAVEDVEAKLRPIRDGLGAHVRPANAVQTKPRVDPTPAVLRAHGAMEFSLTLDMETSQTTSFCGLSAAAYLFAWPDVRTEEDYEKKRMELHPTVLFRCFAAIRHGIDLLMAQHWRKLGLLRSS
jgi:hypothetical protein